MPTTPNLPITTEPLTADERSEFVALQAVVDRGVAAMRDAARALKKIHDRRLYRETHDSFEAFVADRFTFGRRRAYQLLDWATVVDNCVDCVPAVHTEPTEKQARELVKLEPAEQREAFAEAVKESGDATPTTATVKAAVARRQPTEQDEADSADAVLQDCIDKRREFYGDDLARVRPARMAAKVAEMTGRHDCINCGASDWDSDELGRFCRRCKDGDIASDTTDEPALSDHMLRAGDVLRKLMESFPLQWRNVLGNRLMSAGEELIETGDLR